MTGIFSVGEQQTFISFDPRTKLYMLFVFNLINLSSTESVLINNLKLVLAFLTFIMLLNVRKPRAAVIYAVLYIAAYNGEWLLQYISGMSLLGILVRLFIPVMLRMLPGVMVAWCVLLTTKVSEFISGMEKMHIPQNITIPFAVVFRFFPTIADEYRSIRDAMRMRGISFKNGPLAMIEYRLIPLIVSIVKIGDELSAAAVTRGLGGTKARTNYCNIGFKLWDILCFFVMTAAFILFIIF